MDEPTAALGVKESRRVLELILDAKKRGLPIVLISHNMPHVFEVADRIHISIVWASSHRHQPEGVFDGLDAVAFMTGARRRRRSRHRRLTATGSEVDNDGQSLQSIKTIG